MKRCQRFAVQRIDELDGDVVFARGVVAQGAAQHEPDALASRHQGGRAAIEAGRFPEFVKDAHGVVPIEYRDERRFLDAQHQAVFQYGFENRIAGLVVEVCDQQRHRFDFAGCDDVAGHEVDEQ